PITFDVGDKTITARNERALARWLAVQERITKSLSEDSTAMSTTLNLSEIVKAHGVVSLCKYMCEQSSSFGASEADLVNLATQDAHRRYPDVTEAQAFAKLFMESNELRDAIEIAKRAAFQSDVTAEIEKDARAACEELTRIGKARWGSLSPSQRFARAFETNPELARRASPRPGPSTSFPHPSVAKTLAPNVVLTVGDLKPATSTETDPNDATRALAQLRALGARKWPSKSEAESFLLAITDAENVDLVNRALARPTGSTPPRQ
ncbi:MAG TPA: hypothetical protein VKE42_10670, partial [Candidatus Cybelea sp.]|nr:hypothetical protein [Candidatus Cybelea sp.]